MVTIITSLPRRAAATAWFFISRYLNPLRFKELIFLGLALFYAALAIVTEDPDVARITVPALGFDPLRLDDLASAWRNADALAGDDPSRRNVDAADDAAGVLTDYLNGDRA